MYVYCVRNRLLRNILTLGGQNSGLKNQKGAFTVKLKECPVAPGLWKGLCAIPDHDSGSHLSTYADLLVWTGRGK